MSTPGGKPPFIPAGKSENSPNSNSKWKRVSGSPVNRPTRSATLPRSTPQDWESSSNSTIHASPRPSSSGRSETPSRIPRPVSLGGGFDYGIRPHGKLSLAPRREEMPTEQLPKDTRLDSSAKDSSSTSQTPGVRNPKGLAIRPPLREHYSSKNYNSSTRPTEDLADGLDQVVVPRSAAKDSYRPRSHTLSPTTIKDHARISSEKREPHSSTTHSSSNFDTDPSANNHTTTSAFKSDPRHLQNLAGESSEVALRKSPKEDGYYRRAHESLSRSRALSERLMSHSSSKRPSSNFGTDPASSSRTTSTSKSDPRNVENLANELQAVTSQLSEEDNYYLVDTYKIPPRADDLSARSDSHSSFKRPSSNFGSRTSPVDDAFERSQLQATFELSSSNATTNKILPSPRGLGNIGHHPPPTSPSQSTSRDGYSPKNPALSHRSRSLINSLSEIPEHSEHPQPPSKESSASVIDTRSTRSDPSVNNPAVSPKKLGSIADHQSATPLVTSPSEDGDSPRSYSSSGTNSGSLANHWSAKYRDSALQVPYEEPSTDTKDSPEPSPRSMGSRTERLTKMASPRSPLGNEYSQRSTTQNTKSITAALQEEPKQSIKVGVPSSSKQSSASATDGLPIRGDPRREAHESSSEDQEERIDYASTLPLPLSPEARNSLSRRVSSLRSRRDQVDELRKMLRRSDKADQQSPSKRTSLGITSSPAVRASPTTSRRKTISGNGSGLAADSSESSDPHSLSKRLPPPRAINSPSSNDKPTSSKAKSSPRVWNNLANEPEGFNPQAVPEDRFLLNTKTFPPSNRGSLPTVLFTGSRPQSPASAPQLSRQGTYQRAASTGSTSDIETQNVISVALDSVEHQIPQASVHKRSETTDGVVLRPPQKRTARNPSYASLRPVTLNRGDSRSPLLTPVQPEVEYDSVASSVASVQTAFRTDGMPGSSSRRSSTRLSEPVPRLSRRSSSSSETNSTEVRQSVEVPERDPAQEHSYSTGGTPPRDRPARLSRSTRGSLDTPERNQATNASHSVRSSIRSNKSSPAEAIPSDNRNRLETSDRVQLQVAPPTPQDPSHVHHTSTREELTLLHVPRPRSRETTRAPKPDSALRRSSSRHSSKGWTAMPTLSPISSHSSHSNQHSANDPSANPIRTPANPTTSPQHPAESTTPHRLSEGSSTTTSHASSSQRRPSKHTTSSTMPAPLRTWYMLRHCVDSAQSTAASATALQKASAAQRRQLVRAALYRASLEDLAVSILRTRLDQMRALKPDEWAVVEEERETKRELEAAVGRMAEFAGYVLDAVCGEAGDDGAVVLVQEKRELECLAGFYRALAQALAGHEYSEMANQCGVLLDVVRGDVPERIEAEIVLSEGVTAYAHRRGFPLVQPETI